MSAVTFYAYSPLQNPTEASLMLLSIGMDYGGGVKPCGVFTPIDPAGKLLQAQPPPAALSLWCHCYLLVT